MTRAQQAAAARQALTDALRALGEAGAHPPCVGDHRFISDVVEDRLQAARRCGGCPVQVECGAAGAHEHAAVYGGIDRDPTAGRRPGRQPKERTA